MKDPRGFGIIKVRARAKQQNANSRPSAIPTGCAGAAQTKILCLRQDNTTRSLIFDLHPERKASGTNAAPKETASPPYCGVAPDRGTLRPPPTLPPQPSLLRRRT